jgi:hypothetical protein
MDLNYRWMMPLRTFKELDRYVEMWVDGGFGAIGHMIIIGRPGTFKTSTMKQHAYHEHFRLVKEVLTPKGLFWSFQQYEYEEMLCFDDLSIDLFASGNAISIFQQALESTDDREITWHNQDGPETISFRGRLAFLANGYNVPQKVSLQCEAMANRCAFFFFNPSNAEVMRRACAKKVGNKESNRFITSLIATGQVPESTLSVRTLLIAAGLFENKDPDWQQRTKHLLGLPEAAPADTRIACEDVDRLWGTMPEPRRDVSVRVPREEEGFDIDDVTDHGDRRRGDVNTLTCRQFEILSSIPSEWHRASGQNGYVKIGHATRCVASIITVLERYGLIEWRGPQRKREMRRTNEGNQTVARAHNGNGNPAERRLIAFGRAEIDTSLPGS